MRLRSAIVASAPSMPLLLALGCFEPEPEPNWLYQGEWMDVEGRGRTADETCKGTFDYLDRYAEAISVEFGVDEHLGAYHWYSEARFEAEGPCRSSNTNPFACAADGGVYSWVIAVDHEIAHMGHIDLASHCPSVFREGLAVYYSTSGATPSSGAIELLAQRFQALDGALPPAEYYIAGRFMGMLVRRFGLDAVLDVCEINGAHRDPETFASAMISVLGASPDELVDDLANETGCNSWEEYQSRVFACGEAGAARSAGVVDNDLLLRYRMGCDEETTVETMEWPNYGTISIVERIEFLHSGDYWVSMQDADDTFNFIVPPVELVLAPCEPCGRVLHFKAGEAFSDLQLDAGTYWLEMRADKDFSGEFTLRFF
jgi:hypothetical protein